MILKILYCIYSSEETYIHTLCSALLCVQASVAMCDYQVEVNLISYNNSARRLQNGQCCDIKTTTAEGTCSLQDTCDVQFTFSVENIITVTMFGDQDKIVGRYSDAVRFDNCSTFLNGVRNPLTFIIPSKQWRSGVSWIDG
jgi:hypothetical protein